MAGENENAKDTAAGITEMSFLDHLEELRWRIIKAMIGIVVGSVVCGIFIDWIMNNFLLAPALATNPPLILINLKPYGQLVLYMEVVLVGGIILSIPNVFYQFWKIEDVKPIDRSKYITSTIQWTDTEGEQHTVKLTAVCIDQSN